MKKKHTLSVFIFFYACYFGFGQAIFTNPITGTNPNTSNPYTTGQTVDPNLTVSGIGRGVGINGVNTNDRYNANGWDTGSIDLTAYFEFTLTPKVNYEIDFVSFIYTSQRSNTSIANFAFRSSLDGFTSNIGTPTFNGTSIDLLGISFQNVSGSITFRFYAWGAGSSANTFSINDFTFNGYVLSTSPSPELQLVDNAATNQNCGYSIDFGSKALSTNTDLNFDVKNVGSADLTITSFNITGDYSIVSPATPFTVASGNSQTVTVRFTPTTNGTRSGILTINNNDSNEGSCIVNLTGVGLTPAPEINVEGNLGSYPDITNGDSSPSGTDNSLFAAQFIGASQSKSYRINNEGTANLTLWGISIVGTNASDFTISIAPSNTIAPSTFSILEITFSPLGSGPRTAIVSIANNDGDENPFTFTIQGTGNCVSSSLAITPLSGPVGTTITVTGTNFGGSTTVTLSEINASHSILSSTTLEVIVPNNATTGNIKVINDLGCTSSILFNVVDKMVGGCEGGSNLSDLIISEVTDATTGGLTYIEIYNGTGGNVQLNNYSLEIYSNGSGIASGTVPLSPGNLSNNSTYVVAIGVTGSPETSNTCSITGGNGGLAAIQSGIGGINKKDNEHDAIRLLKSSGTVVVDQFGVYMDNTWMDATSITGDRGFNFRRLITASPLPNPNFNLNDWNIIDWAGSGQSSCSTNDYSDIGFYDFSTANSPLVSSGPTANINCKTATISVSAIEGYSGGNGLAYQWYYSAPGESGWTSITNGGLYNNATTSTLNILDSSAFEGYQYYCQIREDNSSCYIGSDAVQLSLPTTTWNGSSWSSPPTIDKIAILDDDYNTTIATNGETSFSACSLIINDGVSLTIGDVKNGGVNTYVEVKNDLTVLGSGAIVVHPQAAFIQINDNGQVSADNPDNIQVNKETAPADNWYEYTYWSSPVQNETIGDGLSDAATNRRFRFNAQNYRDSLKENGNSGNYSPGQDDIDDNGNDWVLTNGSDIMLPGVGYASTHSSFIFGITPGCPGINCHIQYTFNGLFNNGVINVPVYRNDDETGDNNWNLIGNPYPSAISVDSLLTDNASIFSSVPLSPPVGGLTNGAIFLWSQASPASTNNPGNENKNFKQSDYAIINWTMQTAGGDGVTPNRFIPSGQSFFMAYANNPAPGIEISSSPLIYRGYVTFKNSMRVKGTTNNSQFFRTKNLSSSSKLPNKLWVDLTSDNGVFNQIGIGYVTGATNGYDGMGYDTSRNRSNPLYSSIYTVIEGIDKKFAIQCKDPNAMSIEEVLHLGFDTSIEVSTLYRLSIPQVEGEFLSSNPVYLKDNYMQIVHNLSESDYTFTSEVGEFKDRFEIVFQSEALSNNGVQLDSNNLTIIEHQDGLVQFKVTTHLSIKSVQIVDVIGRILYQLEGSGSSEIYDFSQLSQSVYIARVELDNGQIITKRALKRR